MHNFRELNSWKDSMSLAKEVLLITKQFLQSEQFGLIAQMNRSCVSIPSNNAGGTGLNSDKELNRFLNIALGSCFELETQLLLSKDFEYIRINESEYLITKLKSIQKMISGFKNSLESII